MNELLIASVTILCGIICLGAVGLTARAVTNKLQNTYEWIDEIMDHK